MITFRELKEKYTKFSLIFTSAFILIVALLIPILVVSVPLYYLYSIGCYDLNDLQELENELQQCYENAKKLNITF